MGELLAHAVRLLPVPRLFADVDLGDEHAGRVVGRVHHAAEQRVDGPPLQGGDAQFRLEQRFARVTTSLKQKGGGVCWDWKPVDVELMLVRMGYEAECDEVQRRYSAGDKAGAAAAIPLELVQDVALVGTAEQVREQLTTWSDTVATTLILQTDLRAVPRLLPLLNPTPAPAP